MTLIEYVCEEYQYSEFVANGMIMGGKVLVNEEVCDWINYRLKKKDVVRIKEKKSKFVTRSGHKLEEAIKRFSLDLSGKTAIDIGASEGGFTDCMLEYGAGKVYAVDVAYGILNYRLRANEKVVVLERKNARNLTEEDIPETVDLITADVAFISLDKIIPASLRFLKEEGKVVLLFKPQFELPADCLGKNGIPLHQEDVIKQIHFFVQEMQQAGLYLNGLIRSPIKGNNGNVEYLLTGGKESKEVVSAEQIAQCCNAAETEKFAIL